MTEYERISLLLQMQLVQGIGILLSDRAADREGSDDPEEIAQRCEAWHVQFNQVISLANAAVKKKG